MIVVNDGVNDLLIIIAAVFHSRYSFVAPFRLQTPQLSCPAGNNKVRQSKTFYRPALCRKGGNFVLCFLLFPYESPPPPPPPEALIS